MPYAISPYIFAHWRCDGIFEPTVWDRLLFPIRKKTFYRQVLKLHLLLTESEERSASAYLAIKTLVFANRPCTRALSTRLAIVYNPRLKIEVKINFWESYELKTFLFSSLPNISSYKFLKLYVRVVNSIHFMQNRWVSRVKIRTDKSIIFSKN